MRSILLCVVHFIFFIGFGRSITEDSHLFCGDNSWVAYKDEKCFKLINEFKTNDEAEKICNQQPSSPTLVSIKSEDEQEYLSKFLFEQMRVMDNVWISGKRSEDNKFLWNDNSSVDYTNWAAGSPKADDPERNCVEMESPNAFLFKRSIPESSKKVINGKWFNVGCNKRSLVLCEKMQNWSLTHLQKTFMDSRKELQDSLTNLRQLNDDSLTNLRQLNDDTLTNLRQLNDDTLTNLRQLNDSLTNLRQNPVPIGFIYVQLSGQPDPHSLWPMVGWTSVTSNYAGLFFRAEGGGSAGFGSTQEENSPRLTAVHHHIGGGNWGTMGLPVDGWSGHVSTGGAWGDERSLKFHISGGEVRPRNSAMRIWRRTK